MHNVPKLMAGDRAQRLRMHPLDAAPLSIESGDWVGPRGSMRLESRFRFSVADRLLSGDLCELAKVYRGGKLTCARGSSRCAASIDRTMASRTRGQIR